MLRHAPFKHQLATGNVYFLEHAVVDVSKLWPTDRTQIGRFGVVDGD